MDCLPPVAVLALKDCYTHTAMGFFPGMKKASRSSGGHPIHAAFSYLGIFTFRADCGAISSAERQKYESTQHLVTSSVLVPVHDDQSKGPGLRPQ